MNAGVLEVGEILGGIEDRLGPQSLIDDHLHTKRGPTPPGGRASSNVVVYGADDSG